MAYIPICDIEDSRISIYRSLKVKKHERDGMFIAEGSRVTEQLLQSGFDILSCLSTQKCYKAFGMRLAGLAKRGVPMYVAPRQVVAGIIGFDFHQGLMMAARFPEPETLDKVLHKIGEPHLIVALEGINDPENVGLIARSAAAFGASCLLADQRSHNPFYRRAVRVSMGTIFKLPVAREKLLVPALRRLKKDRKTKIIAASPGAKNKDVEDVDLTGNVCLVFGSEDRGVSPALRRIADEVVKIDMSNKVDSLNVACASAIFLQRAAAQRRIMAR